MFDISLTLVLHLTLLTINYCLSGYKFCLATFLVGLVDSSECAPFARSICLPDPCGFLSLTIFPRFWFILPVVPAPLCCSLTYSRSCYTHSLLHYSLSTLLLLTLCWPPVGQLWCMDRVLSSAACLWRPFF